MAIANFDLPEFIFGEIPIKDGGFNDLRQFIFHKGISLTEIIAFDDFTHIIDSSKTSKQYSYFGEDFSLTYHTNNTLLHGQDPIEVLDRAWEFYRDYLIWEDTNED